MSDLSLIALLSLATYRLTRLIVKDTLWQETRRKIEFFILGHEPRSWRDKLHELLTCPYCISVWLSAGVVAGADAYTSVPLPFLTFLAVAAGCVLVWRYIEE